MARSKNARCWCGSGKKRKHCHRDTERRPANAKEVLRHVRTATTHRVCLHANASEATCGRIVDAHSLQRARVLDALVDDTRHVLTFATHHGRGAPDSMGVTRVGWNEASTFTGFCSVHDSETFSPLESRPFSGTPQQCFLHAYRAVCRELFTKTAWLKAPSTIASFVPPEAPSRHQLLGPLESGMRLGLRDLAAAKTSLDACLLSRAYDGLDCAVFEFSGAPSLGCAGTFQPESTLDGNHLQSLGDRARVAEWITMSTDVVDSGGAVILCWPRAHHASRRFVDSILALTPARRMQVLPQLCFLHFENTYFSDRWWRSLLPDLQEHLARLSNIFEPLYADDVLVRRRITPWREIRVVRSQSA